MTLGRFLKKLSLKEGDILVANRSLWDQIVNRTFHGLKYPVDVIFVDDVRHIRTLTEEQWQTLKQQYEKHLSTKAGS